MLELELDIELLELLELDIELLELELELDDPAPPTFGVKAYQ